MSSRLERFLPALYGIGAVGTTLFVTSRLMRHVVDAFAEKLHWYSSLSENHKAETSRALTCVMHHGVVAVGSLVSLWTGNEDLFRRILMVELGFDVYDTLATIAGEGLTGMGPVPVTIHHSVALLLDYVALYTDLVPWKTGASMTAILLGTGAVDLTMVRVVRHTPFYQSSSLVYASAAQFALFLIARVGYFSYYGIRAFSQISPGSSHSKLLVSIPFGLLSLYHLLLGAGLTMALRNGGRMPEKPTRKVEKN